MVGFPVTVEQVIAQYRQQFEKGNIVGAESILANALKQVPNNPHLMIHQAELCIFRQQYLGAIRILSILKDNQCLLDNVYHMLAECYSYLGDKPLAEKYYLLSIQKYPNNASSLYRLIQRGFLHGISPYIDQLLHSADKLPWSQLVYLFFSVAEYMQRQSHYGEAFDFYEKAGQLYLSEVNKQFELTQMQQFQRLADTMPKAYHGPKIQQPIIFIVGTYRSGTTLLNSILSAHTSIESMGEPIELQRLILNVSWQSVIQDTAQWESTLSSIVSAYERFLASYRAPILIDKHPFNQVLLPLIPHLFESARVIHMQRHPLDCMMACFTTHFGMAAEWSYSLKGLGDYLQCNHAMWDKWSRVLTTTDIQTVYYEQLVTDMHTTLLELFESLALTLEPACLAHDQNYRPINTPSHTNVRKPIFTSSIGRWHQYEGNLSAFVETHKSLIQQYESQVPFYPD